MHDDALTWLPHGFSFELDQPPDESTPLRPVLALYAMCVPTVIAAILDAGLLPLLGSLLLPLPTALLWTAFRPRRIRIDVDHQRLRIQGPFGGQRTIELRRIRDVSVRTGGLELVLKDGRRIAVDALASYQRLGRLAGAIGLLRDEVAKFEDDGAGGDQRAALVRLARAARER